MLQLYQSNDMHALVAAFTRRNQRMPENPFQPLKVVVQSFGMGQWLKLRLAEENGIAANVDCILPANLIWQLYQQLLPDLDIPQESPFSIEHLTWRLMALFPDCDGEDFQQVNKFLDGPGDPQIRQFQLGEKIATLFDQYLIYRPEWILGWEKGSRETGSKQVPGTWQRDLWLRLRADPALKARHHRAELHNALIDRLGSAELPDSLPRHISVFGISSLPAIQLQALQSLATRIDVDLYFLNPCQHYWGDIVSEKDVARRSLRKLLGKESLSDDDYLDVGNPLLSSMGKQGREYLEQLLEVESIESMELFVGPDPDTMLGFIKQDILNLEFGGEFGGQFGGQFGGGADPTPRPVQSGDLSVQVHACHSKMREVEILYDQLLRIIELDAEVTPADIIVMMPDVGDYAPYIEAVFGNRMHYTIADRSLAQESAILVAFSSLMALPNSRLASTEVMDLLEVPTIARRFGLFEDELLTLARWIRDAGVRWEVDGASKQVRWQLPGDRQNTWEFGLDRLLLGYAMASDGGLFENILPMDIEAGDGELLGTLCHVVELLARYRSRLGEGQRVFQWRTTILDLLDDFFAPAGHEELDLALVRNLLIRLEAETSATGFEEILSPGMVRYWLDQQLSVSQQSRGFISGGITFATLVPMRSIPFKVVCLLGMNDGEYPREDRPLTFDLMADTEYRKGDRSKRNDDRYLFLEALLSAQQHFYLSYEGRGIKDNQPRPPSVLVSEFTEYTARVFAHDVLTTHPLQPFSEEYYDPGEKGLVTFRDDWYEALQAPQAHQPFADMVFPDDPDLACENIGTLAQFFRHPARFYLRNRLGVFFEEDATLLRETESFSLDGLERYQLAEGALGALLHDQPIADWRDHMVGSGLVMAGDIGQSHLGRELTRASLVFERLQRFADSEPRWAEGTLTLPDGHQLSGRVPNIYGDTIGDMPGILSYRAGTLRKRQLLGVWINHLFVNALAGHHPSLLLSTDKGKIDQYVLEPLDADAATEHLAAMMTLYAEGLRTPLPFLPETSFAYVDALGKGESESRACDRALTEWLKEVGGAEGQDRDYRRLFRFPQDFHDQFKQVASAVYEPLRAHWNPVK